MVREIVHYALNIFYCINNIITVIWNNNFQITVIMNAKQNFPRDITDTCRQLLKSYPILTILGPRQSGKTTLVREIFSDYAYINLEDPRTREIVAVDPMAIFNKYPNKLIIDEAQREPKLLSYLQVLVDEERKEGMYILTGSHQMELQAALSQSLAGRTAILTLLPLSLNEIARAGFSYSANELMLMGGYPRIYQKDLEPTKMYADYVKTYLERDVRQMINIKDQLVFQRFLKLCAGRTGQVLNVNNLANDIGVSNHTIKNWISILQASYIVQLVTPYFNNMTKKVIKSPKLYFNDVGLACYLLDIESPEQVDRDPLRGQLFETLVVNELFKTRLNAGKEPHLYFYRDSEQHEVDIIYKSGSQLTPIEIKSSQTFNRQFLKGVEYFRKRVSNSCGDGYVIYAGEEEVQFSQDAVINFKDTSEAIR